LNVEEKLDNEELCQEIKKKMGEVKDDPNITEKEKNDQIIKLAKELGKVLLEQAGVIPPSNEKQG